jgi:uncharacterized membrane protein YdjX (TVP38/TMEM64 family)
MVKLKFKQGILFGIIICCLLTGVGIYLLGGIKPETLQNLLTKLGIWAPIVYIIFYTIGTLLILPSTPLNLTGGAIFGTWWGTFWSTIAALIAALVSFYYSRTIGRQWIAHKFKGKIKVLDAEIKRGGLFYLFAIRLLPLIPYGIVNFTAGLTSISWRDYTIGTLLGTVPGILPFVMMGAGLKAISQGDVLPLMCALALIGMLVGTATWYRRQGNSELRTQNPELRTQNPELRTQNSELRTQNSELRTRNSELGTQKNNDHLPPNEVR